MKFENQLSEFFRDLDRAAGKAPLANPAAEAQAEQRWAKLLTDVLKPTLTTAAAAAKAAGRSMSVSNGDGRLKVVVRMDPKAQPVTYEFCHPEAGVVALERDGRRVTKWDMHTVTAKTVETATLALLIQTAYTKRN